MAAVGPYVKHTWITGEVITATLLNALEGQYDAANHDGADVKIEVDDATHELIRPSGGSAQFLSYKFTDNAAVQGYFGYDITNDRFVWRDSAGAIIAAITNTGEFRATSSLLTVWNSGNDGASSGLDADLVDGFESAQAPTNSNSTVLVRSTEGFALQKNPACSVTGITKSIPHVTITAYDQFNTEQFDNDALWDGGTPSRFTAQIAGKYRLRVSFQLEFNSTGFDWTVIMRKNGTTTVSTRLFYLQRTGNQYVEIDRVVDLAASDYLEITLSQSSGTAKDAGSAEADFYFVSE